MNISDFDYELPDERIARFPAGERDASKLLVWHGGREGCGTYKAQGAREGEIAETTFGNIGDVLPAGSLLVFNNTRVVRARLVMHRPSGARVEILCLEPHDPADHERAFAAKGTCEWRCMIGNLKKWKSGPLESRNADGDLILRAWRAISGNNGEQTVSFEWDADLTFGQLLEILGRIPIPPYLGRDSQEIDYIRYQTVYSRVEGSVAAPTAGLHFTAELIEKLTQAPSDDEFFVKSAAMQRSRKIELDEVTLHVGAGTFLPVKVENALEHPMHTEHFEATLATIDHLIAKHGDIVAVGTTSVRTMESLPVLGWRIRQSGGSQKGDPETGRPVEQFEPYDIPADLDGRTLLKTLADWMRARGLEKLSASTQIMITPAGFRFRVAKGIVTNFHQPKSTLLLLIAAFTGGDEWRRIYNYALAHGFRFLSYGDSSLLLK